MACTIVTTPALGASDWSSFITQVEYMRRGFMAVSLTNFYGTTASAVAAGSMIEVAGSLYTFTETAIDYTGGGSAVSDLYIYAVPSAGGTTCTVVALNAAPVWVDAKQGFYASAASVSRAIGGVYVGTAATYHTKFIYEPSHVDYCRQNNTTRPLLTMIVAIGEWNMDATTSLVCTIPHDVPTSKIREMFGVVCDDTDEWYVLTIDNGGSITRATGELRVSRVSSGFFDTVSFNATASTVANRGYAGVRYIG